MAKLAAIVPFDEQAKPSPTHSLEDSTNLSLAQIFDGRSDESSSLADSVSESREPDPLKAQQTQIDQQLIQEQEAFLYEVPASLPHELDTAEAEAVAALNSAIAKKPVAHWRINSSMPTSNQALRGAVNGKLPASRNFSYNERDLANRARGDAGDVYDIPESPKQSKTKKRSAAEENGASPSTKRAKLTPKSSLVSPRTARQNARAKAGRSGHSEEEEQQEAVTVPKKLGRPRKIEHEDTHPEQEPASPPRLRGRPRKDTHTEQEPVSPPRPIGRPRKSPVVEPEPEPRNESPGRKTRSREIPVSKAAPRGKATAQNNQETAKKIKNTKPRAEQNNAVADSSHPSRKSNRIAQQETEDSTQSHANGTEVPAETQRPQRRNASKSSSEHTNGLVHDEEQVVVAEDAASAVARSNASQSQKSNTSARRTIDANNARRSEPADSSDALNDPPADEEDPDDFQTPEGVDDLSGQEGSDDDEDIEEDFWGLQSQWKKVFHAIERVGVQIVDGDEIHHRLRYKTSTAKALVRMCKRVGQQFEDDDGEPDEEPASVEDLQNLHDGIVRTTGTTGDLVQDIYAKIIPALISLLREAYYYYHSQAQARRESNIPPNDSTVLLQIINMILDLNQTVLSWRVAPTTDVPILKPIRFGAIVPLREIRKRLQGEVQSDAKQQEAAVRRQKMINELQEQAELEEQKMEAAVLRKERYKFWSGLNALRLQVEHNPKRRAVIALQELPEDTNLDVDSRGRSFERVALFSQRARRTLPQKIQLEDGRWTKEQQEALLESLEYCADPEPLRMFEAIFNSCCGVFGPLREFNCEEIYNMAAYMKSLLLQEEAVYREEPRDWVKHIPDQY